MKILSVDIGTTAMKMGVYQDSVQGLELVDSFSCDYDVNIYNDGLHGDIEPEKWQRAFLDGCRHLSEHVSAVEVISLSGTTPGLTAMGADGEALAPAILMLDQRSRAQAAAIIDRVVSMIWDCGKKVGHAARALEECRQQCSEDTVTLSSLLDRWPAAVRWPLFCGSERICPRCITTPVHSDIPTVFSAAG